MREGEGMGDGGAVMHMIQRCKDSCERRVKERLGVFTGVKVSPPPLTELLATDGARLMITAVWQPHLYQP